MYTAHSLQTETRGVHAISSREQATQAEGEQTPAALAFPQLSTDAKQGHDMLFPHGSSILSERHQLLLNPLTGNSGQDASVSCTWRVFVCVLQL